MILCGYTAAGKGERDGAGASRPPGGKRAADGEVWRGLIRIAYVTINDRA